MVCLRAGSISMFKIGTIINKSNYTQAAIYCNEQGDRHIEEREGQYIIVANEPLPEPTAQEQVRTLEMQTGLTRAVRELVLAENSGASEYVKSKAREIETLAAPLRADNTEAGETVPEAQEAADDAGTV